MILEPEYLDRIYDQWYHTDYNGSGRVFIRPRSYQNVYRHGFNEQRFEEWLFVKGFTVVQRNGKRYLKFSGDDKRLTFFLLKYGVTA